MPKISVSAANGRNGGEFLEAFSLTRPADVVSRPRGAHVSPERWNKLMRHERQSSYSDEVSESDDFSSREASPEHSTPKSLVNEADNSTQKRRINEPIVGDSNLDASDGEAEYLASEEEEYEVDPFEQDGSDGLSSEDASSDVVCKAESLDANRVKNETKSDEVSSPKIEFDERARYNSWNCDGFSNPIACKLSSSQVADQIYSKPLHVHTTPFGQKVLNAMRQPRTDLESYTPNATGEALTPQSLYERPSSPSDAALFKATTFTTTAKAETFRAPLAHEDSTKAPTSEEEGSFAYFVPALSRRASSPRPYSFTPPDICNAPEILNMTQSYYQAAQTPFHMSNYRDGVESVVHKNEEASMDPFEYGAYSQPSRPTAPTLGHRLYPHVYSQQYPPTEAAASNNVLSPPCWRNSYASGNPSSQPPTHPTRVAENVDLFPISLPPSSKPTVLSISEIVSDCNPGLRPEVIHGTKRKAGDMVEEDIHDYQEAAFDTPDNKATTTIGLRNKVQSQEDVIVSDEIEKATPDVAVSASGTQSRPNNQVLEPLKPNSLVSKAVSCSEGPPTKRVRIESSSSVLKTTRTFVSGMLAGGLSVFGALLVYGATAPDSIQDRVRLDFA